MTLRQVLATGLLAALALAAAPVCTAQVSEQMNYQVMLTDDLDGPLADQLVQLVFRIYDVESGGGPLWTETQNVTTNSIGVASVVMGSNNPINLTFSVPLWLQVEVDGEVMTPRRPLVAAPYARHADEADHAADSDELDGIAAGAYALDEELSVPGSLNDPSNPLEWTRLKNVPPGFADGADDAGLGDGHSLDASDGSPVDVVSVDADGKAFIGTGSPVLTIPSALKVTGAPDQTAGLFIADTSQPGQAALLALCDSSSAVVGIANVPDYTWSVASTPPIGVCGVAYGDGSGGRFIALGDGTGSGCVSTGTGAALWAAAGGTGYSGYFQGGSGVHMTREMSFPALEVVNPQTSGWGDAAWFFSNLGVSSGTWTINSSCYQGNAGKFEKLTDDNQYAVKIYGANSTAEGLYVYGNIYSTSLTARGVETSRGTEPVFGVSSPDVELMVSGEGRLFGGEAHVDFDDTFSESITGRPGLRVTATPVGGWSAIYVEHMDEGGFDLRSEAGDMEVEFNWVAVGRCKGHEERPAIAIPDPAEDARIAAEKAAELEARRPEKRDPPQVITRRTR